MIDRFPFRVGEQRRHFNIIILNAITIIIDDLTSDSVNISDKEQRIRKEKWPIIDNSKIKNYNE